MRSNENWAAAKYYTDQFIKSGYSVDDYSDWITKGFEFTSLGSEGRELFHQISNTSAKYEYNTTDKKFTQLLESHNGGRNIESFFYLCTNELGIAPFTSSRSVINSTFTKSSPKPEELKSYSLEDVLNATSEPRIWKFLMTGTLNGIASSSDTGKSTFLRNLTKAIVTRSDQFLGWDLDSRKARVIYVSTEDGKNQQRIGFQNIIDIGDVKKDAIRFIFDSKDIIKNIVRLLDADPYGLIIIDTWGDLVSGDYDSMKAREVLQELGNICTRYNVTVLLAHHTNKASDNIPHKNSIKGTGDFEQKLRCIMMLTTHRGAVWLSAVKGNDLSSDEKEISFKLGYNESIREVTMTNETDYRNSLIQEARRDVHTTNEVEVSWEDVMKGGPHRYGKIVQSLMNLGLSEPGAKKRIKKAVEQAFIEKNDSKLYELCE